MKNYKFQVFDDCPHLCFDLFLACFWFSLLTFIKFSAYSRLLYFNPGLNFSYNCIFFFQLATCHYNQPLKLSYPRNFVALRKHWLLMWSAGWCKTNKASVKSHFYGSVDDIIQIVVGANSPCTTPFSPSEHPTFPFSWKYIVKSTPRWILKSAWEFLMNRRDKWRF